LEAIRWNQLFQKGNYGGDLDDREHIEWRIYCVNIPDGWVDIAAVKRIEYGKKGKGLF